MRMAFERQPCLDARSITKLAGGDPSNISIVHPIRWPGSVHRKGTPRMARIAAFDDAAEIDLVEALECLRDAAGKLDFGGSQADQRDRLRRP
jgi:hypothetical protein